MTTQSNIHITYILYIIPEWFLHLFFFMKSIIVVNGVNKHTPEVIEQVESLLDSYDYIITIDNEYFETPLMDKLSQSGKLLRLTCDLADVDKFKSAISTISKDITPSELLYFNVRHLDNYDAPSVVSSINEVVNILDFSSVFKLKVYFVPSLFLGDTEMSQDELDQCYVATVIASAFSKSGLDVVSQQDVVSLLFRND